MFPKELVSSLISRLNANLSTAVHTSGIENTRPMPAILVDNLSIDPVNYHNSNFVGNEWQDGTVVAEKYRQYYKARVELVVRADDEIEAYNVLGALQNELSKIEISPCEYLHSEIVSMSVGGSGQIRYQFNEPQETEMNQSVEFVTFYDTTHTDFETIDSLSKTYDFN